MFGYAATYDLNQVPIAIYNEDQSIAPRDFINHFTASLAFTKTLTITHHEQIAPALDDKKVLAVLHLGPHFSRDLYTGRQSATVQILIDGRNSNTALIALNYMQNICDHWRGFDDFLSFGDSTASPSEYVLFFS